MNTLKRNRQPFYYCLYSGTTTMYDDYGNETGESIVTYAAPVLMEANISQATGRSTTEQFGNLENYDKVIVTCDLNCPIDENSVLFIGKEPEFTEIVNHIPTATTTTDETVLVPLYNYTVGRVAKSLNSISIAVRKVEVS